MRKTIQITLLLLLAAITQAQNSVQGGNFKGQVRYENNAPASYIRVELWSDGGTFRTTVTTDDQGRFAVQAPFGVIQFKIDVPGYRPVQGRDDLSMSGRADELLTLKAIPGT